MVTIKKTRRTSLDLPVTVKRQLKLAAAKLGRSQKEILESLVYEFLDRLAALKAEGAPAAGRYFRASSSAAARTAEVATQVANEEEKACEH